MDKQDLKTRLNSFVGEATPLIERISSLSDMNELIRLWTENSRNPGTQEIIEARMAAVIIALPVDNVDELPAWFMNIVDDELLLPLQLLRVLFREKVKEINLRLS